MPQLSVYLDDDTIAQVKERAKAGNISVSKFFANALDTYMSTQWPEGFETLFGSISDETFERQPDMPFSSDAKRENF
jgi:hypothetical protein